MAENSDLQHSLYVEALMNVLMFVPLGLLLGFKVQNSRFFDERSGKAERKVVRSRWLWVVMVGAGISVFIEVLQFIFKRGFAELDDVMHNTLGAVIGFGIIILTVKGFRFNVSGFKYWSIRSKSKENY